MEKIVIDTSRRIKHLQEKIKSEGWDIYIATRQASTSWLLGIVSPWRTAIVIPANGSPVAIFWNFDEDRMKKESAWKHETIKWGLDEDLIESIVSVVDRFKSADGKIGIEIGSTPAQSMAPGMMLASEYINLVNKLPRVHWVDTTSVIEDLLVIKESSEILLLKEAARISDKGMEAVSDSLTTGMTENHLAGIAEKAMREAGSEWSWADTLGTEIGSGYRTEFKYGFTQPATNKVIEKNEMVIVDVHPMYKAYLGELVGNFYMGLNPPEEVKSLAKVWEQTVDTLLNEIKPGAVIGDVAKKGFKVIENNGYGDWGINRFGHGLGTCARTTPVITPTNTNVFKENMVMALGTHIYMPKVGGMRLELPTLVTSSGAEPLCQWPSKLHYVKA